VPDDGLASSTALVTGRARAWFATQGWTPFAFQEEVWAACAGGESGLVHAPTGMGKTYAAWLGPLLCGPCARVSRRRLRFR
jgi:ATP-dependent Lhr-like helicase